VPHHQARRRHDLAVALDARAQLVGLDAGLVEQRFERRGSVFCGADVHG
jgi:hypothetical protein